MLNRVALYLLIVGLALLASPTVTPPVAAAVTIVVDDDAFDCVDGTPPNWSNLTSAVMVANPGDTIRVCEGDYTSPFVDITTDYLTITGPGATPENDGVATVHHGGWSSPLFTIYGNWVVVEGLDLDAEPPLTFTNPTIGIYNAGDSVTIQHNEIRNATSLAVDGSGRYVQVLSNNIHDNNDGVRCQCDDSVLSGNTVNGAGNRALEIIGEGASLRATWWSTALWRPTVTMHSSRPIRYLGPPLAPSYKWRAISAASRTTLLATAPATGSWPRPATAPPPPSPSAATP